MFLKVIKQEELDYVKQIKEENLKLKDAIRYKDKELNQKNYELESVSLLFFQYKNCQIQLF